MTLQGLQRSQNQVPFPRETDQLLFPRQSDHPLLIANPLPNESEALERNSTNSPKPERKLEKNESVPEPNTMRNRNETPLQDQIELTHQNDSELVQKNLDPSLIASPPLAKKESVPKPKGQLISKCPFGFIVSTKTPTIFLRISLLASKKRLNQKIIVLYSFLSSKNYSIRDFFDFTFFRG